MTRTFVEQAVGIAAVLGLFYYWTGMPEGSGGEVALSALLLVAALVIFALLARRGLLQLRSATPAKLPWPAHLVLFPMALGFAYWIVWWVPVLSSFGAQASSMVLRFAAGYLVVVAGWLGLLRAVSRAK